MRHKPSMKVLKNLHLSESLLNNAKNHKTAIIMLKLKILNFDFTFHHKQLLSIKKLSKIINVGTYS